MLGARRGCANLILLLALVLGCTTTDRSRAPELTFELDSPFMSTAPPASAVEVTKPSFVSSAPVPADDTRADGLFAYTDPGELPQLHIAGGAQLPLDHTSVAATVRGHVARVRVSQRFVNDHRDPIEVTYSFPLPENSAVDGMRMVIGDRVIESEVHTRERARSNYEDARAAGHTAALLEQERPNIFTQSVANVAPGEAIEVEIAYLQVLTEDAGVQEFVFPMVVGPRFIPGTDVVPDASRITPPIVGEGQRSGNDVSLQLDVDAGLMIDSWDAPTHTVTGAATQRGFAVRLADAQTIPNRDFVIRWRASSAKPRASLFLGPLDASGHGHFELLVQPPQLELDALVGRREMIFVVDRSGSMSGVPLALAKLTVREALGRMRPVDTFDIVGFAHETERLFGTPRPANQHNLVLAERFIDGMQAGGGTVMAGAVEAALAPELAAGGVRYVFFVTDGFIGNETQIYLAAQDLVERAAVGGGRSRVFGIGIGAAPNRALITDLSGAGDGVPLYVSNREHPDEVVDEYYRYVDHPVLEDLRVKWGGLDVDSIYPIELPDLFASHTVVMHGRYRGKLHGQVRVTARVPGKSDKIEITVDVSPSVADDRILSTLWARAKIADLTAATWDLGLDSLEAERAITELGLQHHLVTAYTSLVAIDRTRTVGDGDPTQVVQPIEVPEDVDAVMAGANVGGGNSGMVTLYGNETSSSSYDEPEEMENPLADSGRERSDAAPRESKQTKRASGAIRFSLGKLRASEGVDADALERGLLGQHRAFERCYPTAVLSGKRRIVFRVAFDAGGSLVSLGVKTDKLDSDAARTCLEGVLRSIHWKGLPGAGSLVEVELVLRRG
jgi:Ca-activated chloride channel family protein